MEKGDKIIGKIVIVKVTIIKSGKNKVYNKWGKEKEMLFRWTNDNNCTTTMDDEKYIEITDKWGKEKKKNINDKMTNYM